MIVVLMQSNRVTGAGDSHETNFVLDHLSGAVGLRYRLRVAAF
jgi:hypothetical protein